MSRGIQRREVNLRMVAFRIGEGGEEEGTMRGEIEGRGLNPSERRGELGRSKVRVRGRWRLGVGKIGRRGRTQK